MGELPRCVMSRSGERSSGRRIGGKEVRVIKENMKVSLFEEVQAGASTCKNRRDAKAMKGSQ